MVCGGGSAGDCVSRLSGELSVPTEVTAGLLSAVCWTLRSGAANNLDHSTLNHELLQLGTPKEHAGALARVYREHSEALRSVARQSSLRLSCLESVDSKVILLSRQSIQAQTLTSLHNLLI